MPGSKGEDEGVLHPNLNQTDIVVMTNETDDSVGKRINTLSSSSEHQIWLRCLDISFNQHRFSPCASWNPNAITLTSNVTLGDRAYYIFVNTNNTIYVTASNLNQTLVFSIASPTPIRILASGLYKPRGIFVTLDGNIYVDNGYGLGRVERWAPNATSGVSSNEYQFVVS